MAVGATVGAMVGESDGDGVWTAIATAVAVVGVDEAGLAPVAVQAPNSTDAMNRRRFTGTFLEGGVDLPAAAAGASRAREARGGLVGYWYGAPPWPRFTQ